MLMELIIMIFFGLADLLILILLGTFGGLFTLPDWGHHFIPLLEFGLFFVPVEIFAAVLAHTLGWYGVFLIWGIVHFVIRKIPGIS